MKSFLSLVIGLVVVVVAIFLVALVLESYIASEEITIRIQRIQKVKSDDGEIYYLIHTKNEIFENRDNTFHRKDETEKIQESLKENNVYRVRVVGYDFGTNIPFFLEHRNITAVIKLPEQ